MAKVTYLDGPVCLNCKEHWEHMVAVGPMIFCTACIMEFDIVDNEVDIKSPAYQKWIKVYKESF